MDSASRVSNIATSSSIGSGSHYSRHSSRGCSSDGKGGRGGHLSVGNIVMDRVVNNTISMAISSISSISNVTSIANISGVSQSRISSIIRISLPLGHMDSASRVSHIATSSSIGSGSHYSRHSSRGCSGDRKGGRGGHLGVCIVVSMVNTGNVVNRSHSIDTGNSVNRSSSMDTSNIVDWSSSMNSSNILNSSNMMNRGGSLNSSNMVNRGNIVNSSNIVNRSGSMECSDVVDGGHIVDSRNGVNRGNSLNSSNIVNRGHRLHSSNAVNRVDSLKHWSSISSISSISKAIVSSIIRFSLPLGNMDSASRVGNIATSSSIGSGSHYSRHSSRGCSSDGKGGRGGHLSVSSMVVSMVDRRSIAIATLSTIPSISQPINTSISQPLETRVSHAISSISSIAKDVRVSL